MSLSLKSFRDSVWAGNLGVLIYYLKQKPSETYQHVDPKKGPKYPEKLYVSVPTGVNVDSKLTVAELHYHISKEPKTLMEYTLTGKVVVEWPATIKRAP